MREATSELNREGVVEITAELRIPRQPPSAPRIQFNTLKR